MESSLYSDPHPGRVLMLISKHTWVDCRYITLVLKNSVRRRVFPQGSFFPFVLFFFGSLFLYAVAIAGCALLLRKRTSRFRFCATAAR